ELVEAVDSHAADWPALHALRHIRPVMDAVGLPWGVAGSVGFELASGTAVLHQDSDLDLVLGNIGENFYLAPDSANPVKLWMNDFDDNSTIDKVLTRTVDKKDVPVFLKRDMQDQLPVLKKKSLKHDEFARKSIQDLFVPALLSKSLVREFNYSASVIAINNGNGRFSITKMPVKVQLSSVNAILLTDLNGDSHPDIITGGNQFGFLPQFEAVNDVERIRGLTATARIFALFSSTGVMIIGLVALHFLGAYIEPFYVMPLFIALFILPMIALGDTMEGTARANSWAVVALSPTYIIRPVLILVFMLAAVWMGAPKTAETALVASLAAAYVTTIGQFFNITRRLDRRFEKGPARVEFAPWFKVAVPIFFIEGFIFLLTNSDTVVTGLFLPPAEVAIYFAASKTMALVQFVYFSVKAATAPH
ncbi:MAG: hypothetical protein EOP21_10510, partial [Hyphomicrobiales bacterium]